MSRARSMSVDHGDAFQLEASAPERLDADSARGESTRPEEGQADTPLLKSDPGSPILRMLVCSSLASLAMGGLLVLACFSNVFNVPPSLSYPPLSPPYPPLQTPYSPAPSPPLPLLSPPAIPQFLLGSGRAPRLVFAQGCVGSTIVGRILFRLITMYGGGPVAGGGMPLERYCTPSFCWIQTDTDCSQFMFAAVNEAVARGEPLRWESTKQRKNCFFQQALLTLDQANAERAFVVRTQHAMEARNLTWVSNPPPLSSESASAFLSLGARIVYLKRENVLDRTVCTVRDCFPEGKLLGFPVYSDGQRANLCFERRLSNVTTLATFSNPTHLVQHLRELISSSRDELALVRSWWKGTAVEAVTYEALMAFEHGDMLTSASEWFRLLRSLDYEFPSVASVATALKNTGLSDSRQAPGTHAHVIHNFLAVRDAVHASGDERLIGMLRESAPSTTPP